ncbi:MAG: ROK family protein [Betaproteobacteria bacterium]|jgi:fructokinase|nr:ROK family protein [Betaproteobacteria bacterium]
MGDAALRLGIDLGGTKIEAAVLDSAGAIRWKQRIASPQNNYQSTLSALAALIAQARREIPAARQCAIGIGIPGSLSPHDGRVRNANSTWLNGQSLQQDLEALLGQHVRIANDANCLALSEFTDGAARGAQSVFAIILGTGVGGAHVANGALAGGANRLAGEWGHVPLPWMTSQEFNTPACWCGRTGCIETFLSGPALVKALNAGGSAPVRSVQEIVHRSEAGDMHAIAVLDRFYGQLARALAMVINIIDPEVIVIGGGLSNISRIYSEIPKRWSQWIFSDTAVITRLLPAQHGDASGVRGAAWL